MIDWKKYFDHIYCIHYLPYQNRYKKCLEEIVRVGIKDSGAFSWKITWDSPIFDKLYQVCNAAPSVGCMKVGFSHYMCIKEAYELGFNHILILENDNIFLKDTDEIERILNDLPEDYDICFLDKIPSKTAKYEEALEKDKVNDSFIDIDKKFYVLANCYALSRKGMEHVMECQEKRLAISDSYLRFSSIMPEPEPLKRYAAIKTIAIQNPTFAPESENEKLRKEKPGINSNIDDYKRIGVKFDDYNQ
jgi:GR25 family glycosyltransferase involved in LPS biosynthesis